MSYPIKLKKNIIKRLLADESIYLLSKEFNIARNTLYSWKSKGATCLKPTTRSRVLTPEIKRKILRLKKRDPQITLRKIIEKLKLSITIKSISIFLKKALSDSPIINISLDNYMEYLLYEVENLQTLYNQLIKRNRFKQSVEARFCFFLLFYKKGSYATALNIAKSFHKNLSFVKEQLKLNKEFNHLELYTLIGNCFHINGVYDKANYYYNIYLEKLDTSLSSNDQSIYNIGYSNLVFSSRNDDIVTLINKLKKYVEGIEDDIVRSKIYWSFATYNFNRKEYTLAKSIYTHISKLEGIPIKTKGYSFLAIATCMKNLNQYKVALEALTKGENIYKEDIFFLGRIEKERGLILFRLLQKRKAITSFFRAKKLFLIVDNRYELIVTLYHICRYFNYYDRRREYQIYYKQLAEMKHSELKSLVEGYISKLNNIKLRSV